MTTEKPLERKSKAHDKKLSKGGVEKYAPPSTADSKNNRIETVDLYAKREKIYVRQIKGIFETARRLTITATLAVFVMLPWVNWNGRQALLFDLSERQFHIFHLTLWPQDFILLAWGLMIAAVGLFFVTNLAGRIWCGYTCPQTVWTKLFIWCEELTEGHNRQRKKLDNADLDSNKALRKLAKHTLWVLISLMTAYTFVGYFSPIRSLIIDSFTFDINFWEAFWILFFTGATYMNAGWLREQVCIYMCPYARFQSVMFDKDTLIVSYDAARGEPRGSRSRGTESSEAGLGDCIDCNMCVQVCPTGIDIRNGLQLECIGCAACIDACDSVMDQIGYDRGLVRYTTEHALEKKPTKIFRPRLIGYGLVLIALITALLTTLANRVPLELDILRDRKILYRQTTDGHIENLYMLKIMNMDQTQHHYQILVDNELPFILNGSNNVTVDPGEIYSEPVTLSIDPNLLISKNMAISMTIRSKTKDYTVTEQTRFLAP